MTKPLRTALIVGTLLLSLIAGCGTPSGNSSPANPPAATAPENQALAPDITVLDSSNQQTVTLASLQGKPIVINFWASWCPPCREEMPLLQQAFDQYHDQVQFLFVNLSTQEKADSGKNFLAANNYTLPLFLDTTGKAAQAYQIRYIPSTFFIDRNGMIVAKVTGGITPAALNDNIAKIIQ